MGARWNGVTGMLMMMNVGLLHFFTAGSWGIEYDKWQSGAFEGGWGITYLLIGW